MTKVWIYNLGAQVARSKQCVVCGVELGPGKVGFDRAAHLCAEHRDEYRVRIFSENHPAPPGALIEPLSPDSPPGG
jgi:hypothetical protein